MGIWDGKVIEFPYLTHRGVVEVRRAVPTGLWFGRSDYYPDQDHDEWFLVAWCLDRQAERHFMMSRMNDVERSEDQSLPWRTDE